MFNKEIIFSSPWSEVISPPVPSVQRIPDVYKQLTKRYPFWGPTGGTIKRCIPFLDALTTGYIITWPIDVCIVVEDIIIKDKQQRHVYMEVSHEVPKEFNDKFFLSSHSNLQVPEDLRTQHRTINVPLKVGNPWHIKTPPGYSCIFTQPFSRNLPYQIIDGVVDTDDFPLNVNFPGFWVNDTSIKETHIAKGTPMALVIPFKRENWKMKLSNKDTQTPHNFMKIGTYLVDNYKKVFWKKKSYK